MSNKIRITPINGEVKNILLMMITASLLSLLLLVSFSAVTSSQVSGSTVEGTASTPTSNSTEAMPLTLIDNQSLNTVQIMKSSNNAYNIVDNQTILVGAFDTSYAIVGSSNALNESKDLIIETVESDFGRSPILGYIRAENVTDPASPVTSLVNPFVDQQTINSTILQTLTSGIEAAHNLNFPTVAVKCNYDMNIKDWRCDAHGLHE
jgi:hypothetical protein